MPELPEVEVTRLGLIPHLPGQKISKAKTSGKKLRTTTPRKPLNEIICHNTIKTIDRRAKYLLIRMIDGSVLLIHLGMTGKLGIFEATRKTAKHDHLILELENGMSLRFNDSRRFGSIDVWPGKHADSKEEELDRHLGIEPLSKHFTGKKLQELARNRKMPIKNFLMDARTVAGVGNIYANETLFLCSIHPTTTVDMLLLSQWESIATTCKQVLLQAIQSGGSTISDFIGSSGKPGYFQLQLNVYGRKGEKCKICNTTIEKIVIGGRASFFCPICQQ